MGKIKSKMLIVLISVFLSIVIAGYALPDQEMSLAERRKLAKMPELSIAHIMSGEYMTDMEQYLGDHILGRENMRRLYVYVNQYLFQKEEINGYVQNGDAIYKIEETLSTEYVRKNVSQLEKIRSTYFADNPCFYAIIPDKNYYLENPCGYDRFDYAGEKAILQEKLQAQEIELADCLSLQDYYRTDLHWRQERISLVVDRILQKMNAEEIIVSPEVYQIQFLTDAFAGSYLLPSGYHVKPDTLNYVQSDLFDQIKVFDHEKHKEMEIYSLDRLGTGDDYDIFLGGAKALLTIENPEALSDKELIIFRDSFTSSLAPLLLASYHKITLADLRYTTSAYAMQQIEWDENTQVLFLYQAMTLNGNVFRG